MCSRNMVFKSKNGSKTEFHTNGLLVTLGSNFRLLYLVSVTDKNKGTNCVQNNNRYYYKYLNLSSITQPSLGNLTHRQMLEKYFIKHYK